MIGASLRITRCGRCSGVHALSQVSTSNAPARHPKSTASSSTAPSASFSTSCTARFQRDSGKPSTSYFSSRRKDEENYDRSKRSKRQDKVTDTLLKASRLGDDADRISKHQSDRFSGWKKTPGPSSKRNVARPKPSKDAARGRARALITDVDTLLGPHSASVLNQPLYPESAQDASSSTPSSSARGQTASGTSPLIKFSDFVYPRKEILPGDFVELRRSATSFLGVVLPHPDEHSFKTASSNSGDNAGQDINSRQPKSADNMLRNLFVLESSGQVVLWQESDVMLQIPNLVEPNLTYRATPASSDYVVSSNSVDSPTTSDGGYDNHQAGSSDNEPNQGSAVLEEPIDEPRFEARAAICNKLRILERKKEKELQRLLPAFQSLFLLDQQHKPDTHRDGASSLHERMDTRTGTITTYEATRLLYESTVQTNTSRSKDAASTVAPVTAATVFACHTLLMSNPTHFLADGLSHRTSQLFTCRSDNERRNLELVSNWAASAPDSVEQGYIDSFCDKAGRIRQWRRENPYDDTGAPRLLDNGPDEQWTEQDKALISFLQASLGTRREIQEDAYAAVAMKIVKRAGAHVLFKPFPDAEENVSIEKALSMLVKPDAANRDLAKTIFQDVGTRLTAGDDIQHALIVRLLKDIGALTPWHNPILLDNSFRSLTLSEDGGEPEHATSSGSKTSSSSSTATETQVSGSGDDVASQGKTAESVARKYSLSLDDQVEALRKDFGSLPVYVIDDSGAFELDDGISVEPLASPNGGRKAWVHIHIADPTAHFGPDSDLGRRANRRFTTLYFPEARWAMLPDELVTEGGMGLRASSVISSASTSTSTSTSTRQGEGQRTMTFSALVDLESGLVDEARVQPGLVHDVRVVSYESVSQMLHSSASSSPPSSDSGSTRDLETLLRIAIGLSENRARGTAVFAHRPTPSVSISPLPLPSLPASVDKLVGPQFFSGSPLVELSHGLSEGEDGTSQPRSSPKLAQFMVSELMVLAGRIAATFGQNHGLSLPYRFQTRPSDADLTALLSMRRNIPSSSSISGNGGGISERNLASLIQSITDPVSGGLGHGMIDFSAVLIKGISIPSSGYVSKPGEHFSLGILGGSTPPKFAPPNQYKDVLFGGGYLRATSPLRRFPDMIAHWQIKNQLARGKPLFSSTDIQSSLPQFERQDATARQLMRASERYWIHHKIAAALYGNSPSDLLTHPLKANVLLEQSKRANQMNLTAKVRVQIDQLGIPADLEWRLEEDSPARGTVLDCKVSAVVSAGIRSGLVVSRIDA